MKNNILDIYASDVFSDAVMQERLPKKVYQSLKATFRRVLTLILRSPMLSLLP